MDDIPDQGFFIDLGRLLRKLYDRARYTQTLDYGLDSDPLLSAEDAAWAKEQLKLKT
jgi:hypothetical protein